MFLNIITPCSRPYNLKLIESSINIPKENYRWIIVFDDNQIPNIPTPSFAEVYSLHNENSVVGHAQRNFALNLISAGHIYFNDDDTILHPKLWQNIKNLDNIDFISFSQENKNGSLRLKGDTIKINEIDSHNFIVRYDLCKHIRFIENQYSADGTFASEVYSNSITTLFIDQILSTYNSLR